MARIVLDPDDVTQDRHATLTDGTTVALADADLAALTRLRRQLDDYRAVYARAWEAAHPDDDPGPVERSPLYRRVAELHDRASRERPRQATTLELDLLLQDRVWTSSSGATRPLDELTPAHRANLLRWLERHGDELRERAEEELPAAARRRIAAADPWVAGTPLHRRLQALVDAESERERAIDRARQVVRSIEYERSGEWPDR